jgi:hypothetical protein
VVSIAQDCYQNDNMQTIQISDVMNYESCLLAYINLYWNTKYLLRLRSSGISQCGCHTMKSIIFIFTIIKTSNLTTMSNHSKQWDLWIHGFQQYVKSCRLPLCGSPTQSSIWELRVSPQHGTFNFHPHQPHILRPEKDIPQHDSTQLFPFTPLTPYICHPKMLVAN